MAKINLLNSDNVLQYPDEELIPYACYIDKNIILTKNTDLLITFKVPSFISNKSEIDLFEIRENIRLICNSIIKKENISIQFTTVRKKADIIPFGEERNYFAQKTADIWNKQNDWYNQFVNELYITIIISPEIDTNIFNPLFFLRSLTQSGINALYSKKIASASKTLKKIASLILEKLAEYDIKLLSIKEGDDGVLYSEHMRFLSLLINLEKYNFPLTYDNISDIIRQKRMVYGTDIVEIDKEGKKKFASVFSVKSFQDLTLNQVDKILQLPIELVITETLSFADNKFVVQKFTEQKDITALSEDVDLAYISGLDELVSSDSGKNTDYCIGQTTIMVINSQKNELINDIKKLYKSLDTIGLIAVKENVYLPTIFWSQLPGNFRYMKRFQIVPYTKIGTYASLFNFPTGKLRYNFWGNAITIIPTALNTPYFFNFHNQGLGNTLIVGLEDTGKTTIMNFLLSQTAKIAPKIFYIDTMRSSEIFINAMGGKYYRINPKAKDNERLKINPFLIDKNKKSVEFLKDFIISLVDFQDDGFIEMGKELTQLKTQYQHIPEIVDKIFELSKDERTFENVAKLFDTENTKLIYQKLAFWYKKTANAFVFNNTENTEFNDKIVGISLKTIIENQNLLIPVVKYLLYQIENMANGKPFILAIDNAWLLINNKEIAPQFLNLLETLPLKNVATILTTSGTDKLSESAITKPINDLFATELYLANPKVNLYQKKVFSLQEEESRMLSLMQVKDRNFLLKCINDIIISSINLKDFGFYKKIFSDDNISINAMYKAKTMANSEEPEQWIPIFIKIMEEYEKAMKQKQLKENEMNQLRWEEARSDLNTRNKIVKGN